MAPNKFSPQACVAERFEARDEAGRSVVIEELSDSLHENALGGIEWKRGESRYQLPSGAAVERLDESLFRVVDSGQLLRRSEGAHGVTHHPLHQSTGPADPT